MQSKFHIYTKFWPYPIHGGVLAFVLLTIAAIGIWLALPDYKRPVPPPEQTLLTPQQSQLNHSPVATTILHYDRCG